MKRNPTTQDMIRSFENSATPTARLASWQAIPLAKRLAALRKHMQPGNPCRPCNVPFPKDNPTLADWRRTLIHDPAFYLADVPMIHKTEMHSLRLEGPHVADYWQGRKFLNHNGWFADQWHDGVCEAYAVRLSRFPRLIFAAYCDPWNPGIVTVDLSTWEEIDDCPEDTAKSVMRSADSLAELWARKSREYYEELEREEAEAEEAAEAVRSFDAACRDIVTV